MKTSSTFSPILRLALASLCLSLVPLSPARAASIELDKNFHAPFFTNPDYASRALLLGDGKYLLYFTGSSLTLADQPSGSLLRFFPDGSLDTSFDFDHAYEGVLAAAELTDGRLIVAGSRISYGQSEAGEHILRLNSDGSIDPTFNSADITTTGSANPDRSGGGVRAITIQPDGKILVTGYFGGFGDAGYPGIFRLLSNGTLDTSFQPISLQFTSGGFDFGLAARPAIQSDGKIIIAGDFEGVNGVPDPGVARLNADGILDTSFQATGFVRFSGSRQIRGVAVQSDGKIVLGGSFNVNGNGIDVPLVRLNSDGTLDQSFTYPTSSGIYGRIRDLRLQPDGRIIAVGKSVYRFNTDGSIDTTFSNPLLIDSSGVGFQQAYSVNLELDGKVLFGGTFSDVTDGSEVSNDDHWSVAKLNSNGTVDSTFATSHQLASKAAPGSFMRVADQSTLIALDRIGGYYVPGLPNNFGRLVPDGSVDPNFDPVPSLDSDGNLGPDFRFDGFGLLADGSLLAFGERDISFGFGDFTYGKLFANSAEDRDYLFDSSVASFDRVISRSDGGVIVSSSFADAQKILDNTQVQHLSSNGTLDPSFGLDSSIAANSVQRDGSGNLTEIAAGGRVVAVLAADKVLFSYLALDSTMRLVRLNSDGSLDATFAGGSVPVATYTYTRYINDNGTTYFELPILSPFSVGQGFTDALETSDGTVIVTGDFSTYSGTNTHGIVRLNPDGGVDTSFQSGGGAQWTETTETDDRHPSIDNIELENDGKYLISGTFEAYDGTAASGLATLNSGGSLFEPLDRIASRAKFDYFLAQAYLARQPDGSFYLSGPYVRAGETEQPSFIHINSLGGIPIIGSPLIASGMQGEAFSYQIVASGQPTGYGASGLPAGLTIDGASGLISGAPTAGGTFNIDLSASNAEGIGHATLVLTVTSTVGSPVIISPSTATAILGSPFSFQIVATNSPTSFGATNLPAGLTFNSTLGIISGVPTVAGPKTVGLTATNAAGSGSASLTLGVVLGSKDNIVLINGGPDTARADQAFSFQLFATGISSGAIFSSEGLPGGLTIDPKTGVISGTATEEGSFLVTITITEGGGSTSFTLQLTFTSDPGYPVITSPGSASLAAGAPFTYTIQAPVSGVETGDTTVFSIIGELPPGLSFDPATGTISGTYNPSARKAVQAEGAATASVPSKSVVGTVQLVATNSHGTAIKTLVFLQAVPQLANISTRLNVGTEDSVLIGGFIVTGTAPKRVIIRAIGPALTGFGVNGALADPVLELHQPDQTVVTNDNWQESQETEIEATGLQPSQDLESAILATLEPGAYTAIVRGKDGGTGVGLVEVYDLDAAADSTLGNISTRGFVDTGDNVMIGGVIIGGASSQVLVRALGPVLADFGVSGALEDPVLELHDKDGALITTNDNWKESQQSAIEATGLAPTKDQESAILATLTPDNYTAIVRGKDGTTGVALVEVYNLTP